MRDVGPGEAVFIDEHGRFYSQQCVPVTRHTPCIFEYVYFARPDSIIDNISVHKARLRMGDLLAEKIRRIWPDHDIDVVIPIPDTSRTAAVQVAQLLGIKYREGFVKNRYIGRTFIMPGQEQRAKSVRSKLNVIDLEFRGKNVLLIDDSIVRGTTSAQIIDLAREAGARRVYFASAAPPVRFANVYGIDMPAASELVAAERSEEEVAKLIGADRLIYQDLDDLVRACLHHDSQIQEFDDFVLLRRIRHRRRHAELSRAPAGRALRRSEGAPPSAPRLAEGNPRRLMQSGSVSSAYERQLTSSAVIDLLGRAAAADRHGSHRARRARIEQHVSIVWPDAECRIHAPLQFRPPAFGASAPSATTSCCSMTACERGRGEEWLENLLYRTGFPADRLSRARATIPHWRRARSSAAPSIASCASGSTIGAWPNVAARGGRAAAPASSRCCAPDRKRSVCRSSDR